MRVISPLFDTTITSADGHEWLPVGFPAFLAELKHIIMACTGDDPAPLFRGQSDSTWLMDCTFVRNFVQKVFSLSNYQSLDRKIRQSGLFHKSVLSLLLLKFGVLSTPSQEAFTRAKSEDIDPWYEFLKHCQQYPEKYPENDRFIHGTCLIDWTTSPDVALYFANDCREGAGAIWICDTVETGKTLQIKKLGEILELMHAKNLSDAPASVPLIFHPQLQTFQPRAAEQHPVYVVQMNYSCDLADVWASQEKTLKEGRRIFIKLILPDGTHNECTDYLISKGMTTKVIYPE